MTRPNLRSDDFDEFSAAWKAADPAERAAYAQILAETPADELTDVERQKLDVIEILTANYADDDEDDSVDPDGPPAPVKATPFPVTALPTWAQPFVTELAEQNQTPIDLPALVAIGAMSAVATRGRSTLKVVGSWEEGANLYIAVAMPPGAGKSPVMNALLAPVEEIERLTIAERADERRRVAARIVSLDKRVKDLTKQLESTSDPGALLVKEWIDASEELEDARNGLDEGRMLADDTTPEALIALLHRNAGTISLISTEGGLFDSLGRYVERGTPPNLDGLLKIWSGDTVKVDRKGGEPIQLTKPRATVCLTVQPSVVAKVLGNHEFVGRGLVARFMLAQPESYVGRRNMMAVAEVGEEAARMWRDGLLELHGRRGRTMTMDGIALTAFLGFRHHLEKRRFIGGDLEAPTLTEFSTKCESSVARLALLFALAADAHHVNAGHMDDAIKVGHYWVRQMIELCGGSSVNALRRRVDRFITWVDEKADGPVKVRQVERSGMFRRSGHDDRDAIVEVFEEAERLGFGTIDWSGRSVTFERCATVRDTRVNSSTQSDRDPQTTTESPPVDALSRARKGISKDPLIPESPYLYDKRATCATNDPDPDDWDAEWTDL